MGLKLIVINVVLSGGSQTNVVVPKEEHTEVKESIPKAAVGLGPTFLQLEP
ncbi:hypothetical protein QE152_g40779, partial [Popillia japonica]